jgi:hypothetical protein
MQMRVIIERPMNARHQSESFSGTLYRAPAHLFGALCSVFAPWF